MIQPDKTSCTNCQSLNPADAAFCTHCNGELVKPTYDDQAGPQDQPQPSFNDSNDSTESETVKTPWSSILFAINVVAFTGLLLYFAPILLALVPFLFGLVVSSLLLTSENEPTGCFSSTLLMIFVMVMICFMAGISLFIAFEMVCSDMRLFA